MKVAKIPFENLPFLSMLHGQVMLRKYEALTVLVSREVMENSVEKIPFYLQKGAPELHQI